MNLKIMHLLCPHSYKTKYDISQNLTNTLLHMLQGEDPSLGNPNFWDELFLLKPKVS